MSSHAESATTTTTLTMTDDNFYNVTIEALRPTTRAMLSAALNERIFFETNEGFWPDWRGLARLVEIPLEEITKIGLEDDPTYKVIIKWFQKDMEKATVKKLLDNLEKIERFGVIDDLKTLMHDDILLYNQSDRKTKVEAFYTDDNEDLSILTRDDFKRKQEGLAPQKYDAFVLFADDDIDFAIQLIDRMERDYKLRLCVKDRDPVVNLFKGENVMKLINERCYKIIVILSNSFFKSASNKFFAMFLKSMDFERRQPKIIQCQYMPCQIPYEMSCYTIFDYRHGSKVWNFWERLRDSIHPPPIIPNKPVIRTHAPKRECSVRFTRKLQITTVPEENETEENPTSENSCVTTDCSATPITAACNTTNATSSNATVDKKNAIAIKTDSRKLKWLKKLLVHNKHQKCSVESEQERHDHKKETGFLSHFKRKVALAS